MRRKKQVILVLGGTRSGKSARGLAIARDMSGGGQAWFLATAVPGDAELDRRIARHRQQRPASWPTIDVGRDLAAAIAMTEPADPLLIEGLTLWLSQLAPEGWLDVDAVLDGPLADALRLIAQRPGSVVIVSDEVGLGLVPMDANARAYRDLVGLTHQRIAAMADIVEMVISGLPLTLKASNP